MKRIGAAGDGDPEIVAIGVHLELQLAELTRRRVLDRVLERLLQDDAGALRQILLPIGGRAEEPAELAGRRRCRPRPGESAGR